MATCLNYIAHRWIPNICCECLHLKKEHLTNLMITPNIDTSVSLNTGLSNENNLTHSSSKSISSSSICQENSNELTPYYLEQNTSIQQQFTIDNQLNPSIQQIPCKYGRECFRKDLEHLRKYSHPKQSKDDLQKHLELVEKRFLDSIADLEERNKYLEAEIEKLRIEKMQIAMSHQQLEQVLAQAVNELERYEIKKQEIVEIKGAKPSYWGTNAFEESFREINVRSDSSEFSIISQLLNDTIRIHDNKYGTIYKKNPKKFIVTKITRIHSKKLWHEYCFKKETIIEKNKYRLADCESSKYLKDHPLLAPLLDTNANEYWLFHGCDKEILPILLHAGYDPRVSSLDGMFGGGFYLAENSSKSNQYIPCPGCRKNAIFRGEGCNCKDQENLEFSIILYRAVLGDVHIVQQYDKKIHRGSRESRVRLPPAKENSTDLYDSVMGESITNGGNKLQYREFILYERGQAYPEYVIKYKRSAVNARAPSDMKSMKDRCYFFLKNTFNLRPE